MHPVIQDETLGTCISLYTGAIFFINNNYLEIILGLKILNILCE